MPETLAEYWNGIGEEIQARREGGFIAGDDTPFHRYKAELVTAMFDETDLAGRRVLDIGCGPGAYLLRAADRGAARVVGCDVSSAMLALAQATADAAVDAIVSLDAGGTCASSPTVLRYAGVMASATASPIAS